MGGETRHTTVQRYQITATNGSLATISRTAAVLICYTGSDRHTHRHTHTHIWDRSPTLWENMLVGKRFRVQTILTAGFAGSPTVFILNAVVLEILTREQSEERASEGAELRPDNIDDGE